jgi:hypothetical protein
MLAACMWSMNRFDRPPWTTASLITLAFGCGIASGIFIWRAGKRTKRTERVEERLRRALEMDELQQPLPPDGVLARLQEAIVRYSGANKERGPTKNPGPQNEKAVEQYRGTSNSPNGTGDRPDYASTTASQTRVPGIRIEEEMVVPPHS